MSGLFTSIGLAFGVRVELFLDDDLGDPGLGSRDELFFLVVLDVFLTLLI